jgi:hypothetical protein
MSTSSAPFSIAFFVSNAFVSGVFAPRGKPITVQTFTSVPCNNSLAYFTHVGFTHTEAKLYSFASLQSFSICSFVVYGLSKV